MRKILVSLLVAVMLLGSLVGSASAAYSDTAKNADLSYIEKVTAFSWMKGYPDGSFKPAGNITRAEFAAVVVRALGMEAAAASTAGLATKFADVPNTHWAAGYVNVATSRGIIKGYPDGSFKPEANVKNDEAITMVVRALNRESDAIGEWPVGHIAVAATNNIIGSGFTSSALATRADVSRYIAKAATVAFKVLKTEGWVEDATKTFIRSNNMERVEGTVNSINTSNKTLTVEVTGSTLTSSSTNASAIGYVTTPAGTWTYTLADKAVIGNGVVLQDLQGYSVAVYLTTDPIRALFIEQTSTAMVKKGDLHTVGTGTGEGNYFYLYDDATKYTVASDARVLRNGVQVAGAADANKVGSLKIDDTVTFFLGTDGTVSYVNARAYDYSRWIITDVYTAGSPNSLSIRAALSATSDPGLGSTSGTAASYSDYSKVITVNSDCKVEVNGVPGLLSDLKKDDMVSIAVDAANTSGSPAVPVSTTATLVSGWNKRVVGKVTAKRTYTSEASSGAFYMSIDGVEYRLEGNAEVKDASGYVTGRRLIAGLDIDSNGSFTNVSGEMEPKIKTGQLVSAVLSERGRVRFVDITTGSADVGKITNFNVGVGSYDQWILDIRGTATTYEVAKNSGGTSRHFEFVQAGPLAAGDVVALNIDTDGRIAGATKIPNTLYKITNVYSGDKLITAEVVNTTTWTLSGTPITMVGSTDSVVYVNNSYASGFGSVTQNAYAYIDSSVVSGVTKIRSMVADTFTTIDAAAITASAAGSGSPATYTYTIIGTKGASEPGARIFVFTDATMTTTPIATATADGATASYPGKFTATSSAGLAQYSTLYVKVMDKMGNTTSAPVTVR